MARVGKLKGRSPGIVQPAPEWGRLAASLGAPVARPGEEAEVPRAFPDLPPVAAACSASGGVLRLAEADLLDAFSRQAQLALDRASRTHDAT